MSEVTERDVKVARIEAAEGATIRKLQRGERFNPYSKYTFPIVYVTEDGRRIPSTDDHTLLRDAKAELASLPKAPRWPTRLDLDAAGRIVMVGVSIGLLTGGAR